MEQIVFQVIGVLATIGLLGFGLSKLILYIKYNWVWSNPLKQYIRKVVMDYLKELSKDD